MAFEPLKFGRPYDSITLNRFWTKAWQDNPAAFEFKFARMWHQEAVVLAGNALTKIATGSDVTGQFPYHRYHAQFAAAINNSFENYFTLDAGVYDFVVLCRPTSGSGIVSWSVDGVSIGTVDLYENPGTQFVIKTINGVTITTDGIHTLTGTVASKHASSAGYLAMMYKYCFREA
jgi:hypothetical protein